MITGVGLVALIINRIRADRGVGVASISFAAAFVIYLVAWLVVLHAPAAGDQRILAPCFPAPLLWR